MKYHYTYMIEVLNPIDSRKYYIGVRSSTCKPENDNYYGSSIHLKAWFKENGKDHVKKTILARWNTREEAISHEILLHDCFNVNTNDEFFNRSKQKTTGFDTTGMISPWKGKTPSKETREKMSLAKRGKLTWQNGKPCSEEQKRKIIETKLKNPYKHSEEVINKMKIQSTCHYCNLTGNGSAMKRWHFDNCKNRVV